MKCSCGEMSAAAFYPSHSTRCKACLGVYRKRWQRANPRLLRGYERKYYARKKLGKISGVVNE